MAFFKKKRTDFVDLGERMRKQQEKVEEIREDLTDSSEQIVASTPVSSPANQGGGNFFSNFLGNQNTTPAAVESEPADYSTAEQKRKKLAKRLGDITTSLENLSNSIYKIEQRLEVLERKSGIGY